MVARASLPLVDGDPIMAVQDRSLLLAIMKDGKFPKAPENGAIYMHLGA